ncbi:hypothetical protein C2G38_2254811, partial [Gigaspora rosea]
MTTHKYFNQAYTEWNIINFLNQCNEEPFQLKIDLYLRSLENIINCGEGNRREKAQFLFDKYKSCTQPDYKLARKWNNERANKQIHFHQPTFTSGGTNNVNISGITNGGTFVAKRDHEEMHKYSDHKYFEQESKWDILEFLDECVLEPLERKIECYIRCLETIADTEKGRRREQAKQQMKLKAGSTLNQLGYSGSRPDYHIAKNWDNDRKSSINLYQPIFNDSLGVANIRGGTVIIGSKEKMPLEASSSD